MKKEFTAVFLLAALTVTILAGCQSANANTPATKNAPVTPISHTQAPVENEKKPVSATWISAPHAVNIALAHAELTTEEVHFQRSELDCDDTVLHYDVEFHAGHYEYDFEIDAVTGKILHWEREYDPEKVPVDPPIPTENPPEALITAQEAEEIALNHAGLARQEVMFDRTELDRDRNKTEYEVEFRVGRWEYSYEIDAVTGQILDYDKDFDD